MLFTATYYGRKPNDGEQFAQIDISRTKERRNEKAVQRFSTSVEKS